MRHLFIAFLIALLPVRGWVGEAMALSMLTAPNGLLATCPDHAAPPAAPTAEPMALVQASQQTDSAGEGSHTHSTCDICNAPAMAAPAPVLPALSASLPRHTSPVQTLASSELQPSVKPPIS